MATGTFIYNALHKKTQKKRIKTQTEVVSPLNSTRAMLLSIGTTSVKPHLSICPLDLVWLARYCCKMFSHHLLAYGGLVSGLTLHLSN